MALIFWVIAVSTVANVNSKAHTEEFLRQVPPVDFSLADAEPSDVVYYLFTNSSQKEGLQVTAETIGSSINRNLPTKFFFHGFTTDLTSPWYDLLKREYFLKGPHNVIYVDWSKAGNLTYPVSAANIKPVGKFIGNFLVNSGIPPEQIHLIGHSLGSHLTGFVGKRFTRKTGKKVGRITALDPAGPAFNGVFDDWRLCRHDADFVDAIHTDINYYGYTKPIGHVDFYPNGGIDQPGCAPRQKDDNCHHARSTLFFVESVNTRDAMARRAELTETGMLAYILEGDVVFGDATPTTTRGTYYLKTNSREPYLKI